MASFNFISTMPGGDTTFTFGFWVYIANGSGGFNNHLANPRSWRHLLRYPAATSIILPMISVRSNFPT
jgi:hypothetical protein